MKVNNMHEFVKKIKQCCFCWFGFCNFLVSQCSNNSVLLDAKPKQMKWSVDCCSALNIPVVRQWRRRRANSLSFSLSLWTPLVFFNPPRLSRTQTAYVNCLAASPSSLPPSPANNRGSRGRIFSQGNQQTSGFTVLSVKPPPREASVSVRLTTLPRLHSQRLQWEITFLGEPHVFFKWPYLSLKKWDTWGQWGRECFLFSFRNSLCVSMLLSSRRHFLSLRTLGICRLVLLAGGVSIMSRLLCLKNVALAVSDLKLVFRRSLGRSIHTTCSICSHESRRFLGVKLVWVNRFKKKIWGCSSNTVFVPFLHCVAMLVGLCYSNLTSPSSPPPPRHQQAAKSYKCAQLRHSTYDKKQPWFRGRIGPVRTPDYMHLLFPWIQQLLKDNWTPAPPKFLI